ncbi:MAG: NUDIX hydrolase, partial [Syntrophaceae bacterium]|nr:NUDIX hydrolase [Syntrophaceae bacterium]
DIPRLIREGTISHALVIAAFYRFYTEYLPDMK